MRWVGSLDRDAAIDRYVEDASATTKIRSLAVAAL